MTTEVLDQRLFPGNSHEVYTDLYLPIKLNSRKIIKIPFQKKLLFP